MTKKQTQLRDISREEPASIGYDPYPLNISAAENFFELHLHANNEPGGS
jgi:hypothetical protein